MTQTASSLRGPRMVNLFIAGAATLMFHAVSVASGRVENNGGLGWDGIAYAWMVTRGLDQGNISTQTRPLLALLTRVPYALGLDILRSFELLNYVYAFVLYLSVASLLQHYGAASRVRALVVGNLALCVATSKMFGFYPAQIDLGALAVTVVAFYFIATNRFRWGAVACICAAASREFGVAAALYGMHRAIRTGKHWSQAAALYLPGVATMVLIRWWVSRRFGGGTGPVSASSALQNLQLWASPAFPLAFAYFALVVFGGISALLAVRPRWCFRRLRDEPELLTFLVVVVGFSIAGSLDIWRYLSFALPVAIALIAPYFNGFEERQTRRLLVIMTIFTVFTQRSFERMTTALYFRDWFPLYEYFGIQKAAEGLTLLWSTRLVAVALVMVVISLAVHERTRPSIGDDRHVAA